MLPGPHKISRPIKLCQPTMTHLTLNMVQMQDFYLFFLSWTWSTHDWSVFFAGDANSRVALCETVEKFKNTSVAREVLYLLCEIFPQENCTQKIN